MSGHEIKTLDIEQVQIKPDHAWAKLPKIGFILGAIGLVLSLLLTKGQMVSEAFGTSWLVSYMYFLSYALGGLFFVLIHFATKAGWSVVVRRIAENAMMTIPVFIVLFIPIFMNKDILYAAWLDPATEAMKHLMEKKSFYLTESRFLMRIPIYFAIWTAMAWFFRSNSVAQDTSGDHGITRKLQNMSYPGIMFFALSTSFAAIDWVKTIDPAWYSTMYGVIYFAGCVLSMFAFLAIVSVCLKNSGLLKDVVTHEHLHDLGKYMFGFTIFWTYVSFSQFMLQWYANIPEETVYYLHRNHGSWGSVTKFLIIGHFAFPFAYLLLRKVKRDAGALITIALWLIFAHYIFIHWQVMPNFQHDGVQYTLLDFTTFLTIGGVFLGMFGLNMKKAALVPTKDPRLSESINFENF